MVTFHTIPLHNKHSQCAGKPIAITVPTKLINAKVAYRRAALILSFHRIYKFWKAMNYYMHLFIWSTITYNTYDAQ